MAQLTDPQTHSHLGWFGADPNLHDLKTDPHGRYHHLREVAPVNQTPEGGWRYRLYEPGETENDTSVSIFSM